LKQLSLSDESYYIDKESLSVKLEDCYLDLAYIERLNKSIDREILRYNPRPDYLPIQKIKEILTYAKITNLRDYLLLRVLFFTGVRVSEFCGITPEDITTNRVLTVNNLKHDGTRVTFLDGTTYQELTEYIANKRIAPHERIFNIGRTQVCHIVKKYGNIIGLNIHPHTFRHSFATYADTNGMPGHMIRDILGHFKAYNGSWVYIHRTYENIEEMHTVYDQITVSALI